MVDSLFRTKNKSELNWAIAILSRKMREHTREAIGISSSILSFCPAARVSSFLFPQQLYIGFFPSQPAKHAEENRREHAQRESDGMAHSVQNDRLSFCLGGLTPGHGQPRQTDKSIH